MEKSTNSLDKNKYTSLSIQVRLDGLSFFTQNPITKEVGSYDSVRFRENALATNLVNLIEEAFTSHPALSKSFTKVTLVYDNELYTVVPQELFDSKHASDYLKFNTKILSTDYVAYDLLEEQKKVVVYIPYANVNNYFFDQFGSFDFYHSTTLFIKDIYKRFSSGDSSKVFAHIKKDSFDLAVLEDEQLLLINTYRTTSKEDFIYYLLFAYEQLSLDPNEIPLVLLGNINSNTPFYKGAYTYIRHCTIAQTHSSVIQKEDTLLATLL